MNIVHRFSFNQKTGKRALDILHLEHVPYESNGSDILISHNDSYVFFMISNYSTGTMNSDGTGLYSL